MSISSTVDKSGVVLITGLPQVIPTTIYFQDEGDLLVLNLGTTGTPNDPADTLTLGSDYTVSGGGYNSAIQMQTGSITVVSGGVGAVAVGDQILIKRAVSPNQTTNLYPSGPLSIQQIEKALDKLATLTQQVNEICGRSLQFENFESLSPILSLVNRKSTILGFDSNGDIALTPSSTSTSYVSQIIAGTNISITSTGGDGTGVVTINSTGGSPAGNANEIQYKSGTSFAGTTGMTWNGTQLLNAQSSNGFLDLHTVSNSSTGTSAVGRLSVGNSSSNFGFILTGTNYSGSFYTNAPAGQVGYLTTNGSYPISIAIGGTAYLTVSSAGALRLPAYTTAGLTRVDTSGNVTSVADGGNGTFYGVSGGIPGYYTPGGSGTVVAGTAGQVAWYPASAASVSGQSFFVLGTTSGEATFSPAARTSGVTPFFNFTTPADTGITASTESVGLFKSSQIRTWATTGTVVEQGEVFFQGPTYASASASQTFTDVFTLKLTPPTQGTNAIFTRGHSLGIKDATSAASSITGGLIVATAYGTAATSVGIGGGNVNAGGLITGGTVTSTGAFTASSTSVHTGAATFNSTISVTGTNATTAFTITQTARTSGVLPYMLVTPGADTGLTTLTEAIGVNFATATRTHAAGTIALQRDYVFSGITHAFASASTITLGISADFVEPITGTNTTFTNKYAIRAASEYITANIASAGGAFQVGTLGVPLQAFSATVPVSQFVSSSASFGNLGQWKFGADAVGASMILLKSRNATVGSHTIVQASDILGAISAGGSDGTNYLRGTSIQSVVTPGSTPGTGALSVDLTFSTSTADSFVEMARIVGTTRFQIASGKVFRLGSTRSVGVAAQVGTITIEDSAGTTVTLLTA